MSTAAELVARLQACNAPADLIADVIKLAHESESLQRRRSADAARARKAKNSRDITLANVSSQDSRDASPPSSSSVTSEPREEKKEDRSLRSLNVREDPNWPADGFSQFWDLYPNKVGKPKAEESLKVARKRGFIFAEIMAGLRAYVAKTDNREWCNPTTWINQQRWLDKPGAPPARAGPRAGVNGHSGTSRGQHGGTLADGIEVANRFREQFAAGGDLFVGSGRPSGGLPARPIQAIGHRKF